MKPRALALGVLASGRGSNLEAILEAIEAGRLDAEVRVVVTDVAVAPALAVAARHGVPGVFVDPKVAGGREAFERRIAAVLGAHGVEVVVLAGYLRVLGSALIGEFPGRILNIHPSLLPAFPGLNVQRQAIQHGVRFSGCTVHFVDAGVDTGPIILQAVVPVLDEDTEETLAARILSQEHQIYPRAIQLLAEGRLTVRGRRVFID